MSYTNPYVDRKGYGAAYMGYERCRKDMIDAGYVKLKSAEAIREWLSMLVIPYCHTAKYAQELYDWLKEERDVGKTKK